MIFEPFAIKCCAMTQMKALLYIYWLLITNTLLWNRLLAKSTSLLKILATFLLCGGDFRSRTRQRKRSSFTDVHFWTSMHTMGRETNVCRFCSLITQIIFLVIPKVCLTICVLHFLNLESLKRIYASLFTFRDKF